MSVSQLQMMLRCMSRSQAMRPEEWELFQSLIVSKYDELFKAGYPEQEAVTLAYQFAYESNTKSGLNQLRETLLQDQKHLELRMLLDGARTPTEAYRRFMSVLVRNDYKFSTANDMSVDSQANVIRQRAIGKMWTALKAITPSLGKIFNTAEGEQRLMAALYEDGATDDYEARAIAEAFRDATDFLYQEAVNAGISLGYRHDFHVWVSHDQRLVSQVVFEEWRDFIRPRLDLERMAKSNGEPYSGAEIDALLKDIHNAVINLERVNVMDKDDAASQISNRLHVLKQSRKLRFAGSAEHLGYHQRFGGGGVAGHVMRQIDELSNEIALVQRFGPKPQETFLELLKHSMNAHGITDRQRTVITNLWLEMTGASSFPVNRQHATAVRTLLSLRGAGVLGSAMLSALTDLVSSGMTGIFNGVSPLRVWKNQMLSVLNALDEEEMRAIGFAAQNNLRGIANSASRWVDGDIAQGSSGLLLDGVIRLSGLNHWTTSLQEGAYLTYQNQIARLSDKGYADLKARKREYLQQYGIGAEEWEQIRQAPIIEINGIRVLDLEKIPRLDTQTDIDVRRLASRVRAIAHDEVTRSVPAASSRSHAMLKQGQRPGTIAGTAIRSATYLMHFLSEVVFSHLFRALHQMQTTPGKMAYAGAYLTAMTAMGAVVMSIREVISGKDVPNWEQEEFWLMAFAYGGGASFVGDYLLGMMRSTGDVSATDIGGPVVEVMMTAGWDIPSIVLNSNSSEDAIQNSLKKAYRTGKTFIPGQNMWWGRLAVQRSIYDYADDALGIKYNKRGELGNERWFPKAGHGEVRKPKFSSRTR